MHSIVARELDGEAMYRDEDHGWKPLPTIEDLSQLEVDIRTLTNEINEARLMGFLAEALAKPTRSQ